ncbi:hypothetical protein Tco_1346963, partial [Tanacetum coccineum]
PWRCYDDDAMVAGCYGGVDGEAVGGERRRVEARVCEDRVDPMMRITFGLGRKKSSGGGGGRNPAGEDDRRWSEGGRRTLRFFQLPGDPDLNIVNDWEMNAESEMPLVQWPGLSRAVNKPVSAGVQREITPPLEEVIRKRSLSTTGRHSQRLCAGMYLVAPSDDHLLAPGIIKNHDTLDGTIMPISDVFGRFRNMNTGEFRSFKAKLPHTVIDYKT